MTLTPTQFAQLLKDSTLDRSEEEAVMELMKGCSKKELQQLARVLIEDVKTKEKILQQAQIQAEATTLKMQVELQKATRELKMKKKS